MTRNYRLWTKLTESRLCEFSYSKPIMLHCSFFRNSISGVEELSDDSHFTGISIKKELSTGSKELRECLKQLVLFANRSVLIFLTGISYCVL